MLRSFSVLILFNLLVILIAGLLAGRSGVIFSLFFNGLVNCYLYYYSQYWLLSQYDAIKQDNQSAPKLYSLIQNISNQAGLSCPPAIYLIQHPSPNIFVVGRNADEAALLVSSAFLQIFDDNERHSLLLNAILRIKSRDLLAMTMNAALLGVCYQLILQIDNFLRCSPLFETLNFLLINMLSFSYASDLSQVDAATTDLLGEKLPFIEALKKIEAYNQSGALGKINPMATYLFIVNPLGLDSLSDLFKKHRHAETLS